MPQASSSTMTNNFNNKIMAQLKDDSLDLHKRIRAEHSQKIFKVLMEVAVSAVANADAVQTVITIIDELIGQEESTRHIEKKAEQLRLDQYKILSGKAAENVKFALANIAHLKSELSNLDTKIKAELADIESSKDLAASKGEQLTSHRKICDNNTYDLTRIVEKEDYLLELLRQVIVLLEHSSIQGVRGMVEEADPDAFVELTHPKEEEAEEEEQKMLSEEDVLLELAGGI